MYENILFPKHSLFWYVVKKSKIVKKKPIFGFEFKNKGYTIYSEIINFKAFSMKITISVKICHPLILFGAIWKGENT